MLLSSTTLEELRWGQAPLGAEGRSCKVYRCKYKANVAAAGWGRQSPEEEPALPCQRPHLH